MMAANTAQLQHTLNLSLLNSAMNTQATQAISMLDQMTMGEPTQHVTQAPHPTLGTTIDLRG